jgi:hypothetical protein
MESHPTPSRRPAVTIRKTPDGLIATVNDAAIAISDFAVGSDEDGSPCLNLVLMPGSLSIGEPPAATPPAPAAKVSAWGDASQPDPRESIPGWQPEKLAGQVAGHAERVALRTWEPSDGQERPSAFKRLIRLGGEGGNVAVTA